jgi:hypothetical protein
VLARIRTIAPLVPVQYIAAGAGVFWTPQVNIADNSASTTGVVVQWQAISGATLFSPTQSQADALGNAQTTATTGPLAAGATATASACAWTTVCTTLTAQGVDPSEWRIEIVSGAGQSVGATDFLSAVTLRVTDTASHPVAGAIVQIHQTVDAWQMPCPDHGRCPVPPDEGPQLLSLTSDTNGIVVVTPMQVSATPEVTNIAAATGIQGFVSLSLQKHP